MKGRETQLKRKIKMIQKLLQNYYKCVYFIALIGGVLSSPACRLFACLTLYTHLSLGR